MVRLADVLCVKEKRSVGSDGCVQWSGRVLQLSEGGTLKGVEVWERCDGSLEVLGDGRRLPRPSPAGAPCLGAMTIAPTTRWIAPVAAPMVATVPQTTITERR